MPDRADAVQQFERNVASFLFRHRLLPIAGGAEKPSLGVAVSGGADSVCLLLVLHALRSQLGCTLRVLHVNHGLRGADADADEAFVKELAESLGLPVEFHRIPPATAPASGIEEWARAQRLCFFADCMQQERVDLVALGHHRGDQAETFFFRLMRGAGSQGLGGMAPRNPGGIVRPLLGVSRAQIVTYLRAKGARWREDATNRDLSITRNAIRQNWLPRLTETWNPQLEAVLAGTAEQLRDESAWLDEVATGKLHEIFKPGCFGWEATAAGFSALPVALQRRVLRLLARHGHTGEARKPALTATDAIGLSFAATETIRQMWTAPKGQGRFLWKGLQFARSGRFVRAAPAKMPSPVPNHAVPITANQTGRFHVEGCYFLAKLRYLTGTERDSAGFNHPDSGYTESWSFLNPSQLVFPICLRCWHPGDIFESESRGTKRKLKELFQVAGLPAWRRLHELVLESDGKIVWTSSLGVATGMGWSGTGPALGVTALEPLGVTALEQGAASGDF
jgi:tRNA(Ile)-lysidine synthase